VDKTQAAIIAGAIVAAAVIIAVALLITNYKIHSTGTIKTLGLKVYAEQACINEVSAIDWGSLAPGETSESTLYLKITGSTPANLTMHTENWQPPAAQGNFTLTWDYAGQILQPNQVLQVKFQLHVSSQISGVTAFSNDIVLTATEVKP
jgi:hypothetical protein